jgi:early secretory antigenic target protein ESAT-6
MALIRIDSEAVSSAAHAVSANIARLQGEVASLHTQLSGLQASWQGPAAMAFQQVVTQWHHTQQQVERDLTAITTALGQAARHYADIEAATLRMFSAP